MSNNSKNNNNSIPKPVNYNNKAPKTNNKTSFFKKLLIVVFSVLFLVILLFFALEKLPITKFRQNSEKLFKLPELSKGFVPLTIAYDDYSGDYFVTGTTTSPDNATPIYIMDTNSKKYTQKVYLIDSAQNSIASEFNDIVINNQLLYVCDSVNKCIYTIDPVDIRNSSSDGSINYLSKIDISLDNDNLIPSSIFAKGNELFINYSYKKRSSLILKCSITGASVNPISGYIVNHKIHDFAINDDSIYLLQSVWLMPSKLYNFELSTINDTADNEIRYESVKIKDNDIKCINISKQLSKYSMPSLTTSFTYKMDNIVSISSSASKQYKYGKLTGGKYAYLTSCDYFNNIDN